MPPAAAQTDKAAGQADFVMTQKPDQFLASKFKGTDVIGTDNKKIGDVADILFDKDGKIEAYVIQIGGFLGMGGQGSRAGAEFVRSGAGQESRRRKAQAVDDQTAAPRGQPHALFATAGRSPPARGRPQPPTAGRRAPAERPHEVDAAHLNASNVMLRP